MDVTFRTLMRDEWWARGKLFEDIDWFLDKMTKGQTPTGLQLREAIREFLPGNWQGYNGALAVTVESIARVYEEDHGIPYTGVYEARYWGEETQA